MSLENKNFPGSFGSAPSAAVGAAEPLCPVAVELIDSTGVIQIANCRKNGDLSDLLLQFQVEVDGQKVQLGREAVPALPPGAAQSVPLLLRPITGHPGQRVFLQVIFKYKKTSPWAGNPEIRFSFELPLRLVSPWPRLPQNAAQLSSVPGQAVWQWEKVKAVIGSTGLVALNCGDFELLQGGLRPNIWSFSSASGEAATAKWWRQAGYDRIEVVPDRFDVTTDQVELHALMRASGIPNIEMEFTQIYRALSSGALEITLTFIVPPDFADLPRLGVQLELPANLQQLTYLGQGPQENYRTSSSGARWGCFQEQVADFITSATARAESGNRSQVEFAALTDVSGQGLLLVAPGGMDFSLQRATDDSGTAVNCDLKRRGVASRENLSPRDQIFPGRRQFRLLLKPLMASETPGDLARQILF